MSSPLKTAVVVCYTGWMPFPTLSSIETSTANSTHLPERQYWRRISWSDSLQHTTHRSKSRQNQRCANKLL